ncbi:MAG: tRNA pseudouridine(38-40) synthase TruA [Tenericutes bacterium HGW-Tenericutes-5]|jgi:tRNA pseudouridine38-40 synthase|nr:MAG: tRNA pseudouridine(38-40) synthase TruA [Tenericutes bacterium HGW-Tenericutes-5]
MFENLNQNVALKVDDLVILNKELVEDYIAKNKELFEEITFTDHLNYHMKYGYNKNHNPVKIAFLDNEIQRIIIKTKNFSQKRVRIDLMYDGSAYHGFQIQANGKTIQGELSKLISEVNNKEILVQGASRTDALVHAKMQVIHFDDESNLSKEEWLRFLNNRLPKDIFITNIELMHPLFHSRYDVYEKEYVYKIKLGDYDPFLLNYAWNIEYLDFVRLNDQIKKIIGTHDFTSFAKGIKGDNVRTIYKSGYKLDDDILEIHITGNGFLRYMVRLIIAHAINYATKKIDIDILEILNEKSRRHTKNLAPAEGLYLNKIIY